MDYIINHNVPKEYIPKIQSAMAALMDHYDLYVGGSKKPLKVDSSAMVSDIYNPITQRFETKVKSIYVEPQYNSWLHKLCLNLDIFQVLETPSLNISVKDKDTKPAGALEFGGESCTGFTLDGIVSFTIFHHPRR